MYRQQERRDQRIYMVRVLLRILTVVSLGFSIAQPRAMAQTQIFNRDGVEYTLELPSPLWHTISRLDVHDHVEFIYGDDPVNGYLHMRKEVVPARTTASDLLGRDRKQRLSFLSGYIACKDESFAGHLKGRVLSYEYTDGGKQMMGRIYYLEVDNRTFYILHFTGRLNKIRDLGDQMDSIARSFRLK